jgi:hypothetical protein
MSICLSFLYAPRSRRDSRPRLSKPSAVRQLPAVTATLEFVIVIGIHETDISFPCDLYRREHPVHKQIFIRR